MELEEDQTGRSPTEEQMPNADEGVIGKRLRENVGLMHLGPAVTKGNTRWIGLQERPKVMVLQCDVLGARSELVRLCHADAGLVVFVDGGFEGDQPMLVNLVEVNGDGLSDAHEGNGCLKSH